MEPTKSAMYQDCRPMAGSGAELVGGALAAGGRACRHRGSRHEGRCRPVPGCLRWVLLRLYLVERHALAAVDPRATVWIPARDQHPVL
jgi:hypothetical protein